MSTETTRTEYDAAFAQGIAAADIHNDGTTKPFAVIPDSFHIADLEHLLDEPRRIRQQVNLQDETSFTAYLDEFKAADTRIFADRKYGTVTAVIDYHGGEDSPSWCTHRATLTLEKSPEWNAWIANNGKSLSQVQFAEFLEDNIGDIAEPDNATILEASKALEAKKTVHFKSGVNLDNGAVQFTYAEEVNGTTSKASLKVPTRFVLGLSPYSGGQPIRVQARLRYRLDNDKLTFTYLIERPHKVLEFAFDKVLESVAAETQIKPLIGSAG